MATTPPDLAIINAAEVVSPRSAPARGKAMSRLSRIAGGGVAVSGGRITTIAASVAIERLAGPDTVLVDAGGRSVIPAFVDPHTHALFAGERRDEFARRLRGESYLQIQHAGGGIGSTVQATRAASDDELVAGLRRRLGRMLAQGTAAAEVKSGYGLSVGQELRMLSLLRSAEQDVGVVTTFLGAHIVPSEFDGRRERYVDLVCEGMLPAVAGEASFCDVFAEEGAFTRAEARRILEAARQRGMGLKLHADQLTDGGGAELAVELEARSADHLGSVSEAGVKALGGSSTAAVLLPASSLYVRGSSLAPARQLIEQGAIVAIGSDCNPGSSPVDGMPLMIALACLVYGLTTEEALCAATANAAYACGLEATNGQLSPGSRADIVILDSDDYRDLGYRLGARLVHQVIKAGRVVARPPADGPL